MAWQPNYTAFFTPQLGFALSSPGRLAGLLQGSPHRLQHESTFNYHDSAVAANSKKDFSNQTRPGKASRPTETQARPIARFGDSRKTAQECCDTQADGEQHEREQCYARESAARYLASSSVC